MCFEVGQTVIIGDSSVDFKGLIIDGPAGRQSMEPKIIDLLRVFVENAGEVLTREDLITAVWGVNYGGDERLSRAISILRKALGDQRGQHTHIVTISRVGYRLIAKITDSPQDATTQSIAAPDVIPPKQESVPLGKILATDADQISTLSNTADADGVQDGFTLKRAASVLAVALSVLLMGFWMGSNLRSGQSPSIQARLDQGFSNVENFAAKNAIVEAKKVFTSILSEDPNHAAARAGLAFALFREYSHLERDPELLKRAKSHAEAAFRQDEHLGLSSIAAAWAAEFGGDLSRSHEHLDRADILLPNHPLALEGRFRTFARNGDVEKAIDVVTAAILLHPDEALFYTHLADILTRYGRTEEAEVNYRRAIEIAPDNARPYAQLAHNLYLQGRTEDAIAEIQKGLEIDEAPLLYNNLGTYLFFQGHYNLAASAFEKTLGREGDAHNLLYWANLGDAYRWSENRVDEAATAYRRALQLLQVELDQYPENVNLKSRAAMFNAKLGNLDLARSYMDSFSLSADMENILFYRAVVTYEILSEREKALEFLEAAIKADYPLIEIFNDPELSRLRQDPSYHRLLATTQSDLGE